MVESIRSILPIVDEFVIALGPCDDRTEEMVRAIGDPKIRIIPTVWNERIQSDYSVKGFVYGQQKSIALFNCTGDWAFYLEADEVVQETAIGIARNLPEYRYDPKVCRFKTWLLNQASWRIKDQIKKRAKSGRPPAQPDSGAASEARSDPDRTSTINRTPDPAALDLDALFEEQWRKSLFARALDRVKEKFSLKQFQVFDLLVQKEWPAAEVARSLGVTLANVYVTKHRISAAIKKEIKRLEKESEVAPPSQASTPAAKERP